MDESTIWQELDEFVVTKELDQHLRRFFSTYCEAIDHAKDADIPGKIGVWVSGFFGSGKSHFFKILSYLLQNEEASSQWRNEESRRFLRARRLRTPCCSPTLSELSRRIRT